MDVAAATGLTVAIHFATIQPKTDPSILGQHMNKTNDVKEFLCQFWIFPASQFHGKTLECLPQLRIVFFLSHEVQNGSFFFSDANGSRGFLLRTFSSVRQGQHISKCGLTMDNHTGHFISLFSPRSLKGCLHSSTCRTQLAPLKRPGPAVISNGSFRVRDLAIMP